MDNNFEQKPEQKSGQKSENNKPRKKVTKKVLRQRQLTALAIIALVVLLFFILIARGCSNIGGNGGETSENATTTTETTENTTAPPETTTTTTTTTTHPLAASVQLSTREIFLDVGETGISYIQAYPEGCAEENEVWWSLDPSIASVDEFGHIEGIATGETFIILGFDNNPGLEIEIKVSVAGGISTAPENSESDITSDFDGYVSPDTETTPVYDYTDYSSSEDTNNF